MNTVKHAEKSWKTPTLVAVGVSVAALLAAPAFTSAGADAEEPKQLFSPYRTDVDLTPSNRIVAQSQISPALEATR